jgi:hypothetical protein
MALPEEPTPAQLAEFLRRNDPRHIKLKILASAYESAADNWTARERRDVVAAAQRNQSIRYLWIDVDGVTAKSAKLIASIVAQLGHVSTLKLSDACEADEAPPLSAVDSVVAGVVRSASTIANLKISSCVSASALLKVTQRYPELEELEFSDTFGDDDAYDGDHRLVGTDRDALAMAIGYAMGRLPSLRRVALLLSSTHPRVFGILSALHAAPAIKTVEIGLPHDDHDGEVVLQAAFVCACTRTLETAIFRAEQTFDQRMVEISPLFGVGPAPSFSPSIKVVEFRGCCVDDLDENRAKRAAKSLENVESLSFFMSPGSFARQVVGRMPRLRKFSFVSREDSAKDWEDAHEYILENAELLLPGHQQRTGGVLPRHQSEEFAAGRP